MKKMLLMGLSSMLLVACNSGTNQSSNSTVSAQNSSALNSSNPVLCSLKMSQLDSQTNQMQISKGIKIENLSEPATVYLLVLSDKHGTGYCDTGFDMLQYQMGANGSLNKTRSEYLSMGSVAQSGFMTPASGNSPYKSLHVLAHRVFGPFNLKMDEYYIQNFKVDPTLAEDTTNPPEALELPSPGYTVEHITYSDVGQYRYVYTTGFTESSHNGAWVGAYIENITSSGKKVLDMISSESYSLVSKDPQSGKMVTADLQPINFTKDVSGTNYVYFSAADAYYDSALMGIYMVPILPNGSLDFANRIIELPNLSIASGDSFNFQLNSGNSFIYLKNGLSNLQVSPNLIDEGLNFDNAFMTPWDSAVVTMALDPGLYSGVQYMYVVGSNPDGQANNMLVGEFSVDQNSGMISQTNSFVPRINNNISKMLFAQVQDTSNKCRPYDIILGSSYSGDFKTTNGVIKIFSKDSKNKFQLIGESAPALPEVVDGYVNSFKPCGVP